MSKFIVKKQDETIYLMAEVGRIAERA